MTATRQDRDQAARDDARRESTDLGRNYRRIGISAVAAAAPYCSGAKTLATPSETQKFHKRDYEAV